jgi:hypothetical protein
MFCCYGNDIEQGRDRAFQIMTDDREELIFARDLLLKLLLESAEREVCLYAGYHFLGLQGFGNVIDGSGLEAFEFIVDLDQGGHKNDGNRLRGRIRFELATGFKSVKTGHEHIEQDQVWLFLFGLQQGTFSILGDQDFKGVLPQRVVQHFQIGRVIIDE